MLLPIQTGHVIQNKKRDMKWRRRLLVRVWPIANLGNDNDDDSENVAKNWNEFSSFQSLLRLFGRA